MRGHDGVIDPGPVKAWRFKNGIEAKTWTHLISFIEVAGEMRWMVFEAPNGHIYTVGYDVPQDWKTRWRYEHIYRRILDSMEFKEVP